MTPDPAAAPTTRPPERRVLRARSPEDLLAVVPVVLGFDPDHCVVMLTTGPRDGFHARVDLPPLDPPRDPRDLRDPRDPIDRGALDREAAALRETVELLLEPARRHGVTSVVFVLYCVDRGLAACTADLLGAGFGEAGITVTVVLRTDGSRWWALHPGDLALHDDPGEGVPYDVSAHPFRVQSVVEGTVTHRSRAELAASLDPDPAAVAVVQAARRRAPRPDAEQVGDWTARHARDGSVFTDVELAAVARAVGDLAVGEVVRGAMQRDTAPQQVRLWSDAVRRTPADLRAGVAGVLGFACWLAGQGALAWCAVDRARDADPDDRLAAFVADLLSAAVPPSSWTPHPTGEGAPR